MKKVLLLLLCIFLITGCKVEYNLIISNDLTIEEKVNMTGTDDFFDTYYKSSRNNVIKMIFDESRQNYLKENGYNYEIVEGERPFVVANKQYSSLDNFAKETIFFKQYFENVIVTEKEGIVSLTTDEFIPINPDSIERYYIRTSTIKITPAYKVIESNATSFDEKTNTYTWHIDDETKDFSIKLSYDNKEIYVPPKNNLNIMLIIIMIIFIIGLIVVYVINKKNVK